MDIYEVLNRIVTNRRFELSAHIFTQIDREELDEKDKQLFDILKNISSIGTKIYNSGIEFHPMFVMADGNRTFSVEDITDDYYVMLKNMDFQKVPLVLRALVADILWTKQKDYKAAKIAAEAYWDLFQLWYTNSDHVGTLDMIRRAVCISLQTKQIDLYSRILEWLNDFLVHDAANQDGFFSLRIMELFAGQKDYDVSLFISVIDSIISLNQDNVLKIEQAYELKTKCLYKLKKNDEAINNNLSLAKYYIDFAEKTVQRDIQGVIRAGGFFQKAITLYRNNGKPEQAEKTHKRLVEIQKEIPKIMVPVSVELDIKGVVENIIKNMEGLTFEESILRLTQMIVFDKREEIKSKVIEEYKNFPLSHMFGKNLINDQGQTIFALPPLDVQNPERDQKLLELHMHQNILKKQQIAGDIWIKNVLSLIRDRFVIDNSMVEFLVKDNPIVPEGRQRIFQSAISLFLRGEFYEAIHIMAPQTENLFRNIAKEVGGLTVTLENDGSSMEKVLSSIFNLPEMLDCYDNDILFIFKGLLNEQAGANIRNEVAHGIIGEKACSSGVCLYFGVAVIKLLSYTSLPCYEILKNSEKLRHFEIPPKGSIKAVKKE